MFEQTFVNVNARTSKPWTIGVSLFAQVVGICALLIAPLLHIAAIRPVMQGPITVRLIKTEPPPPPVTTHAPVARIHRIFSGLLLAPRVIPRGIALTPDPPDAAQIPSVAFGTPGVLSSLPSIGTAPPPAPKPEIAPKQPAAPVKVSSGVQEALLVFSPKPVYPPLAKAARVEGSVRLRALIARDGSVENLQLISGPPLLVRAALEAIQQWRYKPTLLNGEAVPVETEITVTFRLQQ